MTVTLDSYSSTPIELYYHRICYYVVVDEYRLSVSQQDAKNSVFRKSHSKQPHQIRKCISNNDHLKTLLRVQVIGGRYLMRR